MLHTIIQGKCISNPQQSINVYLSEWIKFFKIVKIPNASEDAERMNYLYIAGGTIKSVILKIVCLFLIKLNMQLSYYPATVLLSIYHREMKTMFRQKPAQECLQQLYF